MTPERRADVRILYGDPALGTRRLYRQALVSAGYTHLREFESLEGFADLLHVAQPDLVFMDVEMPGGDAIALTSNLRHGRLGVNPYLPIIMTTWEPQQSLVRRIIDSGADDLLVKPLSTRALLDRVEAVGLNRKPFVVTSDYIGPDRRRSDARGGSAIQLIHVPNPMRYKLTGNPLDPHGLQHEIMVANEEINRQRLRASAFRIAFVAEQIVPVYKSGLTPDDGTLAMLNDLITSTEDIQRRVANTELGHVGQICDRLLQAARQIAEPGASFVYTADWQKPLDLLKTLGEAVLAFFNPDRDAAALAGEVADAIDRYRARKAAQQAGQLPA
ncbi:MAG: PleD family two-component system response regulator [Ferrovibrio sp.]|jgi:CheY-like chemotaxis protein|uniref:response regulator n=1 Tax=Ferrovibrio sp. TaxID=1917215 RepID=UPI00391D11AD